MVTYLFLIAIFEIVGTFRESFKKRSNTFISEESPDIKEKQTKSIEIYLTATKNTTVNWAKFLSHWNAKKCTRIACH